MVSGLLSEVRLITGAYEELMSEKLDDLDTTTTLEAEDESDEEVDKSGAKEIGRRIRIASSKYYDIILYMLPKGARYQHKWPEGSWTIIQPLTGLIEIAQLRLDRDGFYTKMRPRDVRGGGDGSGFLGSGDSESKGYSSSGEECVRYLGGPFRSYTGKAMKSSLLEVVVRPPIAVNVETAGVVEEMDWESISSVLTRVLESEKVKEEEDSAEEKKSESDTAQSSESAETSTSKGSNSITASASEGGLNKKMGMEFENVGGLDAQLDGKYRSFLCCFSVHFHFMHKNFTHCSSL